LSKALEATVAEIGQPPKPGQTGKARQRPAQDTLTNQTELEKIRASLRDLQHLLENDDIQAYYLWHELAPAIQEMIGQEAAQTLGLQIERFDYRGACERLKRLLADDRLPNRD